MKRRYKTEVIEKMIVGEKKYFAGINRSAMVISSDVGKKMNRTYHAKRDELGTTVWRLK